MEPAPQLRTSVLISKAMYTDFRSTSNWEQLDQAMETNRAQRLANQCPENCSAKVAADALFEVIEGKGKPLDS